MIDSHCHLDLPEFEPDWQEVLSSAFKNGVERILIPGTTVSGWQRQQRMAADNAQLDVAFGLHPYFFPDDPERALAALGKQLQTERQVRICGTAQKLTTAQNARYFLSRPKDSQLAAWASQQSQPISSRELLMTQFHQMKEKFAKKEIPLPDFWGGFKVMPHQIEFWQGGEDRLHDRFEYTKQADNSWTTQRLMP